MVDKNNVIEERPSSVTVPFHNEIRAESIGPDELGLAQPSDKELHEVKIYLYDQVESAQEFSIDDIDLNRHIDSLPYSLLDLSCIENLSPESTDFNEFFSSNLNIGSGMDGNKKNLQKYLGYHSPQQSPTSNYETHEPLSLLEKQRQLALMKLTHSTPYHRDGLLRFHALSSTPIRSPTLPRIHSDSKFNSQSINYEPYQQYKLELLYKTDANPISFVETVNLPISKLTNNKEEYYVDMFYPFFKNKKKGLVYRKQSDIGVCKNLVPPVMRISLIFNKRNTKTWKGVAPAYNINIDVDNKSPSFPPTPMGNWDGVFERDVEPELESESTNLIGLKMVDLFSYNETIKNEGGFYLELLNCQNEENSSNEMIQPAVLHNDSPLSLKEKTQDYLPKIVLEQFDPFGDMDFQDFQSIHNNGIDADINKAPEGLKILVDDQKVETDKTTVDTSLKSPTELWFNEMGPNLKSANWDESSLKYPKIAKSKSLKKELIKQGVHQEFNLLSNIDSSLRMDGQTMKLNWVKRLKSKLQRAKVHLN